jgi:ComF family protein
VQINLSSPKQGWFGGVREVADRALDLVFPRSCVACEDPVDESSRYRFVCSPCSRLLTIAHQPACKTCGFPFFGAVETERSCPHCLELLPLFREARTAVLMKGPARRMIHELKYRGQVHLMKDIRQIFSEAEGLLEFARGSVLLPVPLHPRKRRERGFNQSRLLAECVAGLTSGAQVADGLERVKDTESQTHLDRERRKRNLKNAFAMRPNCGLHSDSRFILVDDVFTTGSTLNACAAVLRRSGISCIDVITFGHG